MSEQRELDLIVYGASGFTGRLVCEYLQDQYGVDGDIKWAMAGRSEDKLRQVRDEMGIADTVSLVVADSADPASVASMVASTRVLLTTVGPYQLYGSDIVKACAGAGTDYVDLCGEPAWMHQMIAAHGDTAKASGARIVFSCGFDSIPFDLGVLYLQQLAADDGQAPLNRVKGRVRAMKGTMSGGTLASFRATMAAAGDNPELVAVLTNPFALAEGFTGPEQPSGMKPLYEEDLGSWSAPFVMATINTKNIHRSNLLLDHRYGKDFVYDEMLLTGPGEEGEAVAKAVASDNSMAKSRLQPGEGPSKEERDKGCYDVMFVGSNPSGYQVTASVKGDRDPGYGSTSKMIAEAAVCLVLDPGAAGGGIWTPAAAPGSQLIERLQANAGLSFQREG
ncbi:saccharopine dehydrogenase [Seongchinamella sediminis]|uniref:Saccharopine dehydrogenase n=1 Tax=Seongchinamella sediminis TaxID=2283635 RepID=A0A3L7DY85_9GAMM|nr:saccharopine dehydrogenase NADP-binding domain-containing protein [Seongchinamella sediminis]RLQ22557.1 saccharopine dehydrogenase [Seongchinamella sediminis]